MRKNYIDAIKNSKNTGAYNTIWTAKSRKYSIICDGYGLGITDGWTVDRPVIYHDKTVGFDFPEALPKYIKEKFKSLAYNGYIVNMHEV